MIGSGRVEEVHATPQNLLTSWRLQEPWQIALAKDDLPMQSCAHRATANRHPSSLRTLKFRHLRTGRGQFRPARRVVKKYNRWLTFVLILATLAGFNVERAFAVPGEHRSRSDKNIAAIGHRNIAGRKQGNWYSIEGEKRLGEAFSAQIEASGKIVNDRIITDYVDRIADKVSRNSDTKIPITVRLLDSEQVTAVTLPGGYQYLSRRLLLQLENEDELASVLARGIAHTALRSATRLKTLENLANIGFIPLTYVGSSVPPTDVSKDFIPTSLLGYRRRFELDADYFGVQYIYKAGYNPESFVQVVRRTGPVIEPPVQALSAFPQIPVRLQALHKEIADLLLKRDAQVTESPDFEAFKKRLRDWKPAEPVAMPADEIP